MPGKKPTSTAATGKASQSASEDVVGSELPVDKVGTLVGPGVGLDVGLDVLESITHCSFSQMKPRGQQSAPHAANFSVRSVFLTGLSGWVVAFCRLISQLMGLIIWQLWPSGQHIMEVALLSGTHLVEDGQQKLEGKSKPEH